MIFFFKFDGKCIADMALEKSEVDKSVSPSYVKLSISLFSLVIILLWPIVMPIIIVKNIKGKN